jgi:hypothetical protein
MFTLKKRYFDNYSECLQNLQNIFSNNIDKIGYSTLKLIGYKS